MKIIVCIKQVPDTSEVRIDPATNTLVRQGVPCIINPFDENAIEEALRLREKHGGTVTVLSMGPPQVREALRDAIAMGADEAILLSDPAFAGADTFATSYTLSMAVRKIGAFDVLLFGKQAIDGDTAQVGPGVAELLGIPEVAFVRKIEVDGRSASVERVMEEGYEKVSAVLPAAFTVLKEINVPRLASLKGKLKARKYEAAVWTSADLGTDRKKTGLNGSPTWVKRIFTPEPRGKTEILQGDAGEKVKALVSRLAAANLV